MKREVAKQFNEEVERYRRTLLYFARKCDWEEFKVRAGRLYEYLERVEASERERRFYRVFSSILAMLTLGVVALLSVDPTASAGWIDYRRSLFLAALAGCSFELFFYLNFRWYAGVRMAGFLKRREAFIKGIERDFRAFDMPPQGMGT